MNYKKRVARSINAYAEKQAREFQEKPKRKNAQPEKAVVLDCLSWLKKHGFDVTVTEAKAVYSVQAGRYLNSQLQPGFSDITGNDEHGRAVFIECKAPGKLSTVRPAQHQFLSQKIHKNSFAVVVDSVERLEMLYVGWRQLPHDRQREMLLSELPTPKAIQDIKSEEDDLPW